MITNKGNKDPHSFTFSELLICIFECQLVFFLFILKIIAENFRYYFSVPKSLKNETVLITGAGSGIGRLLALELAKKQCNVIIWDINLEQAEATCQEIEFIYQENRRKEKARRKKGKYDFFWNFISSIQNKVKVGKIPQNNESHSKNSSKKIEDQINTTSKFKEDRAKSEESKGVVTDTIGEEDDIDDTTLLWNRTKAYKVDVSNRFQVYETAKKIEQEYGSVTILINNAGIVPAKSFLDPESSDEMRIRTMEINAMSLMWTFKAFLPSMIANKHGHLVTMGSSAGLVGVRGLSEYCASKFACIGFHESIQTELHVMGLSDQIHTTLVNPYYINTGMFNGVTSKNKILLPILQPEWVTKMVMHGILHNIDKISLPWLISIIQAAKTAPIKAFHIPADYLGVHQTMESFRKIRKL